MLRRHSLLPLLAAGALLATACGGGTSSTTDTSVNDTSVNDTLVADTAVNDTFVADTLVADTLVADTGPGDTLVADTTETDTAVADTTETDTADTTATDTADTTATDATSPADVSAQITAIRGGTLGPIEGATVTFVKPTIGNDPAGFFVQAEVAGPALFVKVDPTTLSPVPVVGDIVSFTVDTLEATSSAAQGRVEAATISGFSVLSSGADISPLVQAVDDVDLVTALNDYESEIVTATLAIKADPTGAGVGFVSASADTNAVVGSSSLKFRIPADSDGVMTVGTDCVVDFGPAPVWRYFAQAQLSAASDEDFSVVSCPAPDLLAAAAATTTQVVLTFSRLIDPASVNTDGSDFAIDNSVVVSAAAVDGKSVTLTVSALAPADYVVTVGTNVVDFLGAPVATDMNTATFTVAAPGGCASDLFFSEYVEGSSNNKALEIANFTGATVDLAQYVIMYGTNGAAFSGNQALSGTVADGDVFLICHGSFNADFLATGACDMQSTSTFIGFNGDDARGLGKIPAGGGDPVLLDVIGLTNGTDPGTGWDVAGVTAATANHTLRRLSTVTGPNADWATSQASEWQVLDQDTFDGLGSHVYGGICP